MKYTKGNPGAHRQPERPTQVERRTISVEEAGRILGVSRGAAYAYARDGSIRTIRLGKRLLVPRAALEKMLNVA
jgi:excisionase family DNA binding protein